jgi:glycine/D-amino acid oxidase-like deaminating enzyme
MPAGDLPGPVNTYLNRMRTSCYPKYQRQCGWNALLPARSANAALTSRADCDVAIIGAGYTGVAAARRCAELEPAATVVLLDSSEIGEGNPGRNSGFMLEIALANDAEPAQLDRMTACNRLIGDALAGLKSLAEQHDIPCDLVRAGTYRAAAGASGIAALRKYRDFLEAADLRYEVLDQRQLQDRLGTAFYREGLYSPHCYLVQPAALIRGLADSLPSSITLYENSPAVSIESSQGKWKVRTPDGAISASRLIVANNAFCKQLGIARSRIVAMFTSAALTEPLPRKVLDALGSDPNWGLLPAHRLGSTLRRTADGRLLIRSLYGYESETDSRQVEVKLRAALQRRFPQLTDLAFAGVWSGATGFTLNGAPVWGEYEPGLFVSTGCNGGGVVKGTLFGALLAELAVDRETADVAALFGEASWMPPEPLRRLGFRILSGIEAYKGRAEV